MDQGHQHSATNERGFRSDVTPDHWGAAGAQAAPQPADDDEVFLSPAIANKVRDQREAGFKFLLRATSLAAGRPVKAHVRRLYLADKVAIGALESHIQRKLLQALGEAAQTKTAIRNSGSVDLAAVMDNLTRREDLVNAACVAGFIRPHLILSEAWRQSPDQILVTDIAIEDRVAYFDLCQGAEDEAKNLEPFLVAAGNAHPSVVAG